MLVIIKFLKTLLLLLYYLTRINFNLQNISNCCFHSIEKSKIFIEINLKKQFYFYIFILSQRKPPA